MCICFYVCMYTLINKLIYILWLHLASRIRACGLFGRDSLVTCSKAGSSMNPSRYFIVACRSEGLTGSQKAQLVHGSLLSNAMRYIFSLHPCIRVYWCTVLFQLIRLRYILPNLLLSRFADTITHIY